ncbi:MAG: RNA-binding protein [Bryobacterales bacterium]|jgi:RNA recognition motif-containing protein|nr:RNA-binding protein [Bryobacterales bacterium]
MSFTIFLGNLPTWVTAEDIQSWLMADNFVCDSIKVIRSPETQESKGFAFVEAPNAEEMQAIIKRFDRAPLDGKLLRANPAQPPRARNERREGPVNSERRTPAPAAGATADPGAASRTRSPRRGNAAAGGAKKQNAPKTAFAEELAKAL